MIINGKRISDREQHELESLYSHDAKEIAGVFHEMNRSEKFRLQWPNQDQFVQSAFKNFYVAVRAMYAERLGDPHTSEDDKQKMFKAIMMMEIKQHENEARGIEADTRLQIMPNTQTFVGDKTENRKIIDRFGKAQSYRAYRRQLLNAIAGEIGKL